MSEAIAKLVKEAEQAGYDEDFLDFKHAEEVSEGFYFFVCISEDGLNHYHVGSFDKGDYGGGPLATRVDLDDAIANCRATARGARIALNR